MKKLLITCDDLGMHPTINDGVVEILSCGVVKSASILASGNFYDDAVDKLKKADIKTVGVHLAASSEFETLPLYPVSKRKLQTLAEKNGAFCSRIRKHIDEKELYDELEAQILKVKASGFDIDHLDGHMFFYEEGEGTQNVFEVVCALAEKFCLPLRVLSYTKRQRIAHTYFIWDEYPKAAQRVAYYKKLLETYNHTLAELIIHPAKNGDELGAFSFSGERRQADYQFFSGITHQMLEKYGIESVSWQEI